MADSPPNCRAVCVGSEQASPVARRRRLWVIALGVIFFFCAGLVSTFAVATRGTEAAGDVGREFVDALSASDWSRATHLMTADAQKTTRPEAIRQVYHEWLRRVDGPSDFPLWSRHLTFLPGRFRMVLVFVRLADRPDRPPAGGIYVTMEREHGRWRVQHLRFQVDPQYAKPASRPPERHSSSVRSATVLG